MDDPEPSYAYLLHNNEDRVCQEDVDYCTWDENGNPIPLCFQYPKDKRCLYNTRSPNTLFMGCYDDPSCDGKPVGKTKISSKDPPFAYTIDGKCLRSSKLCDWLTDKIVVPKCAQDIAKCRDITDDYLIGCYTEETCGGNVMKTTEQIKDPIKPNDQIEEKTTTKQQNKPLSTKVILLLVFIPILVIVALLLFYYYKKMKRLSKQRKIGQQNTTRYSNQLERKRSTQRT
jgi:hypothetical protein